MMNDPEQQAQDPAWNPQELADLLKIEPLSGPEIVEKGLLGGWADLGIEDSQAWVEEQRRKRSEDDK